MGVYDDDCIMQAVVLPMTMGMHACTPRQGSSFSTSPWHRPHCTTSTGHSCCLHTVQLMSAYKRPKGLWTPASMLHALSIQHSCACNQILSIIPECNLCQQSRHFSHRHAWPVTYLYLSLLEVHADKQGIQRPSIN